MGFRLASDFRLGPFEAQNSRAFWKPWDDSLVGLWDQACGLLFRVNCSVTKYSVPAWYVGVSP